MSIQPQRVSEVLWPCNPDSLAQILEFYDRLFVQWNIPPKSAVHLQLILEELIVNIIKYSGAPIDSLLQIHLNQKGRHIYGELVDHGLPFDPLDGVTPDIKQPMQDRSIGGLGIFFVQKLTKTLTYHRVADTNCLSFSLAIPAGSPELKDSDCG